MGILRNVVVWLLSICELDNDIYGELCKKLMENVCKVLFYLRYMCDIVVFVDKYIEGKVVFVLEGGYSDWVLMSVVMGYIVGMRGFLFEGCDEWWVEKELISVGFFDCLYFLEYFGFMSDLVGKGN